MTPPRILVFRNGQIGNTMATVPLLRALRRHWPQARIDVVVDGLSGDVLRHCPYVDELLTYDRRRPDPGGREFLRLVARMRRARYDMALIGKRFFRNELLARLSGARRRIGFHTPGHRPFALTDAVPYREDVPVVDLVLALLGPLGVPAAGRELEIWWTPEDEAALARVAVESAFPLDRPYAVLHTEAGTLHAQRVPASVFAELSRELGARGMGSVFLFGAGERDAAAALAAQEPRALFLIGQPIGRVACALQGARLFVGHDSGPAHLSAAVALPGLVIYPDGPDFERHVVKWKPPGGTVTVIRRSEVNAARLRSEAERILTLHPGRPR